MGKVKDRLIMGKIGVVSEAASPVPALAGRGMAGKATPIQGSRVKRKRKAGPGTGRLYIPESERNYSDAYLWDIGNDGQDLHGTDREFRHDIFERYPSRFSYCMARIYAETYHSLGRFHANRQLIEHDEELQKISLTLAMDDDELVEKAKYYAQQCLFMAARLKAQGMLQEEILEYLAAFAKTKQIPAPTSPALQGRIKRLSCPFWWRRQLRKYHSRRLEEVALRLNLVNKRDGGYISQEGYYCYTQRKTRERNLLENMRIVNEDGDRFALSEFVDSSVSNPKIRRFELMTRLEGFQQIADELGYAADFHTITCPSRMHSCLSRSLRSNPKYDGTTPIDAQKYLTRIWAQMRSALSRRNITVFGLRVAEPHRDGTPHWHLLLFVDPAFQESVREICKQYALREDPDEPGAEKHRYLCESIKSGINPKTGKPYSAAGYLAKYIAKNLDGIPSSDSNDLSSEATDRVRAWASTWTIRQFQQIGGPSVTVWRELRKLRGRVQTSETIEAARQAADQGDWAAYIRAQGGITARKNSRIRLHKVWIDEPGRYGEPKGFAVNGVECGDVSVRTHKHNWKIAEINHDYSKSTLSNPSKGESRRTWKQANGGSLRTSMD